MKYWNIDIDIDNDNDIVCAIESFHYAVQWASWNVIPTLSNVDTNIQYLFSIKDKLTEKKKQGMLW